MCWFFVCVDEQCVDEQYMWNYMYIYMDETLYMLVSFDIWMSIDEHMTMVNFICISYMCCDLFMIYVL